MREGYRVVRLKRVSDTAVEGRLTCKIPRDSDSPRGLLILHSSECVRERVVQTLWTLHYHYLSLPLLSNLLNPVISVTEVISGRMKSFRVRCTSTGGRVLNMSVTGPDFNSELSNIQAVGTLKRMGNDSYTATTAAINGTGYSHQMERHLSLTV